ncbi:MAG TPA: SelB C-terminal domain-containing protein [Dermatophilaceae bacterium]|nr:SelB C-terminal domain-containing protein [Dermatophilaceae bacterium]
MAVVATAGHVDHGKSALVRALTGMEPDRWAEERRRGMTLDLGFVWTELAGRRVAFVDVPGHERLVASMLAGIGPVAGVLLCVAADEGWMPQTAEHAAAVAALGQQEVLVAVTRSDLADPRPAAAESAARLGALGIDPPAVVAVSAVTGAGLPALREALAALAARVGTPRPDEPARLWVDRCFTVRGSGTVVTGTLPTGSLGTGDAVDAFTSTAGASGGSLVPRRVVVRGLQSCGEPVDRVVGPARVAVNLRGVERDALSRGDRLAAPGAVAPGAVPSVRVRQLPGRNGAPGRGEPGEPTRVGQADGIPGPLPRHLTWHVGTASRPVSVSVRPDGTARLRLRRRDPPLPLVAGDRGLLRDPGRHLVLAGVVVLDPDEPHRRSGPRSVGAARAEEGRSAAGEPDRWGAVERLRAWLVTAPLAAPTAEDLRALDLAPADLAAAERAGVAVRLHGAVVAPSTVEAVRDALAHLPGPFTVGEVCRAVGTTRRVVVPVLERLDARHVTRRLPDGRRVLRDVRR